MVRPLCLLLVLIASTSVRAQPAVERPLTRVLEATVGADGRVDYGTLAREYRDELDAALAAVAQTEVASLRSDAAKTAFLVNAYNAHVLRLVVEHRATHLEQQGLFEAFFETPVVVAGRRLTLNQLEHGVLRRQNRVDGATVPRALRALRPSRVDFRIHAALNCAAVSCPPLQPRAYRAATLERDLSAAFRAFARSHRAARLERGRLVLSSIFDWFAEDFEAQGRPLGDVILQAAGPGRRNADALRQRLAGRSATDLRADRRTRFAYDWTVNRR